MSKVEAYWSGKYPSLCIGEWTLLIDGKDVSDKIPEEVRRLHMNTYGIYQGWNFKDMEQFYDYEDGLQAGEWIEENLEWLENITKDPGLQDAIYEAFRIDDWRHRSCGGCI